MERPENNFEVGDLVRLHPRHLDGGPVLGFVKHTMAADLCTTWNHGWWLHVFLLDRIGNVWNQGETLFLYAGPDEDAEKNGIEIKYDVFIVAKHNMETIKEID